MASKPDVSPVVPTVVAHGDVLKQRAVNGLYDGGDDPADVDSTPDGPSSNTSSEPVDATDEGSAHAQDETAPTSKADEPAKVGSKRTHDEVEDDTPEDPESSSPTLRQLIHYRIVVNEVCLKMSNFRNGEHLVKLIEDCVITHRDAYVHFGLLHRDISAGNMMILPRIEEQNGRKRVTWRGVLIDWELAKYVPKDDSAQSARQPERTGTWQFMSVTYVVHPERPIQIADELESFLHVLIYHGVRYLRHSLGSRATDFIVTYFDTFLPGPQGRQVCSIMKTNAVKMGTIFIDSSEDLQFLNDCGDEEHPLNDFIFKDLLPLFVERYRIEKWDDAVARRREKKKAQLVSAMNTSQDADKIVVVLTEKELPPGRPSEECTDKAAKLNTHDEFLNLLRTRRTTGTWPENDKMADQLSPEYDPRRLVVATMSTLSSLTAVSDSSSSSAAKKRRVNHKAKSSLLVGPKTPHAARPCLSTQLLKFLQCEPQFALHPPQKAIDAAHAVFRELFHLQASGESQLSDSEDHTAAVITRLANGWKVQIDALDRVALPHNGLRALQYKSKLGAPSGLGATGGLYARDHVPQDDRPDWTHIRMFVVVKKGGAENDPFDSPHGTFTRSRSGVWEQLTACAHKIFVHQHRTAVYALFINGSFFRAMCWSCARLFVTPLTDFAADPTALLRLLWAFSSQDEVGQGLDPTATLLHPGSPEHQRMDLWAAENRALDLPFEEGADVTQFFIRRDISEPAVSPYSTVTQRDVAGPTEPVFRYVRDEFRTSISDGWPRYKLRVGPAGREILVGKPLVTSNCVFGRGTRAYIGLDAETGRFVFLKDSWRPCYRDVECEGTYLEEMASRIDISIAVPTVVAHGDVLQQWASNELHDIGDPADHDSTPNCRLDDPRDAPDATNERSGHTQDETAASSKADEPAKVGSKRTRDDLTDDIPEDPESSSTTLRQLIHYRIVVNEVCLKMSNFRNGEHLVKLIEDCVITHRDAYVHFGLLHRDISADNMMILPRIEEQNGRKRVTWRGVLIDWELAKYVPKDDSARRSRKPERTGTWQFMSVAYVVHPDRPIKIADELESFLHVLIYHGVRHLRHSLGSRATDFIIAYFDAFLFGLQGRQVCSIMKTNAVKMGTIFIDSSEDLRFLDDSGYEEHPLNELIFNEILPLFVERYRIDAWDDAVARRREKKKAQLVSAMNISQDADKIAVVLSEKELPPGRPSEECRDNATKLDAHDEFLNLLRTCRTTGTWPDNDKVADQLSPDHDPRRRLVANQSALSFRTPSRDPSSRSAAKKGRVDLKAGSLLLTAPNPPKAARPLRPPNKYLRRK
ncbi:hypothetical protein BD413DRAFT_680539 [Trametes elegans]|nr:hypothetical protein BD413DRAFT_680539 [Trametes elegans]